MKDGIIKGDGTSRLLRADLPATYDELRAKAAAGTQPLDVLFNSEGWTQQPTFLSTANLLADDTAEKLELPNTATPNDALNALAGIICAGMIVIWSGNANSIPDGWALCDGSNGTPDLRDRFVMGGGGTAAVGSTGGTATLEKYSFTGGTVLGQIYVHETSDARPPYYTLCYIMKI